MYLNFDLKVIVQVLTLAFLCKNLEYKPQSIKQNSNISHQPATIDYCADGTHGAIDEQPTTRSSSYVASEHRIGDKVLHTLRNMMVNIDGAIIATKDAI